MCEHFLRFLCVVPKKIRFKVLAISFSYIEMIYFHIRKLSEILTSVFLRTTHTDLTKFPY